MRHKTLIFLIPARASPSHILLHFSRFSLSDGHEQEQLRKEVDGAHVVIGFYKYIGNDSFLIFRHNMPDDSLYLQIRTIKSAKFTTKLINSATRWATISRLSSRRNPNGSRICREATCRHRRTWSQMFWTTNICRPRSRICPRMANNMATPTWMILQTWNQI